MIAPLAGLAGFVGGLWLGWAVGKRSLRTIPDASSERKEEAKAEYLTNDPLCPVDDVDSA